MVVEAGRRTDNLTALAASHVGPPPSSAPGLEQVLLRVLHVVGPLARVRAADGDVGRVMRHDVEVGVRRQVALALRCTFRMYSMIKGRLVAGWAGAHGLRRASALHDSLYMKRGSRL